MGKWFNRGWYVVLIFVRNWNVCVGKLRVCWFEVKEVVNVSWFMNGVINVGFLVDEVVRYCY